MEKRIILTEAQLQDYVERKKAEKIVGAILEDMNKNSKYLNEQISLTNANKTVLENYRRKKLLTPRVEKMLKEYSIVDEKGEII
jgi:hypothetical protein